MVANVELLARIARATRAAAKFVALTLVFAMLAPTGGTAQPLPRTSLRFSFEWRLEGPMSVVLVPMDRNYFGQEGIDITFDESGNALEAITRVASGSHDVGIADITTLIKYRDQNPSAPVKAIFMVYNTPPFSVVARKSRRITEPKLVEGKKIGASPVGATLGVWPAFAKLNGIDASKVAIEEINNLVRIPMLAAGQIDGTFGFTFRDYVDFKDRGVPVNDIVVLPIAEFGLKAYGSAIIVNSKLAAEKPEVVKGFVRALLRGVNETRRDPATAVDSVIKRDDVGRKEIELERLSIALDDNIVTPEVRANGFGAVSPARFEEMMNQLALAFPFKSKPKMEDIFDSRFLPPAADRAVLP